MQSENITYLIGAGASANAIPVVGNNFNNHLITFCDLLIDNSRKYYSNYSKHRDFIERIIRELPHHYSVDTCAIKLFFIDRKEYDSFKLILS